MVNVGLAASVNMIFQGDQKSTARQNKQSCQLGQKDIGGYHGSAC